MSFDPPVDCVVSRHMRLHGGPPNYQLFFPALRIIVLINNTVSLQILCGHPTSLIRSSITSSVV